MYNIQELSEEAGAAWNLVLELRQPAVGGCGLQERYFHTKEKCQSIAIVSTRYCSGNICIFLILSISVSLVLYKYKQLCRLLCHRPRATLPRTI